LPRRYSIGQMSRRIASAACSAPLPTTGRGGRGVGALALVAGPGTALALFADPDAALGLAEPGATALAACDVSGELGLVATLSGACGGAVDRSAGLAEHAATRGSRRKSTSARAMHAMMAARPAG
jgi:hypothetical protein